MGISKYHTNKQVRKRIDSCLEKNATIWANLGTESKFDVGSKTTAKKEWRKLLSKIKKLCPIYWEGVRKDDD